MSIKLPALRIGCIAVAALAVSSRPVMATQYHAGPGQPYTSLSAVPWKSLQPGDVVNIHWRATPYAEHILLSQSGTAAKHIVVKGIPDPATLALPVITGNNAIEAPNIGYLGANLQGLGVVMISPRAGYVYGYIPSYIDIEGLKVIDARGGLNYAAPNGAVGTYGKFTSAIYLERAQHIAIRNCELTASGLGLFANSKYGGNALSADILVEYNNIHHNGVVNNWSCHNCYTEANGITYQFNHIGPVIAGSYADAIKDRSAKTVIRYNWFESGPGDCLDLIENQSDAPYIQVLPDYDKTWVYGNTFYNGPTGATNLVNYGGMDSSYSTYRKGTLCFYNNTVINQQDKTGPGGRWSSSLFLYPLRWLMGQDCIERIDCRNNIIYNVSATPGAVPVDYTLVYTDNTAILDLGVNYLSPGIQPLTWKGNGAFAGSITGWAGQMFGDANGINNPGFVDPLNFDFRLAFNSACINKGQAQHPLVTPTYTPLFEFLPPMTAIARPVLGAAIDLGAHEDSGLSQVTPLLSIGNATLAEGNSGTKLMSFLVALSTPAPAPITVNYTTVNGSAIAGSDYVKTQGVLLIPAGASTAVINVPITGDVTVESDETFTVVLSNAVNAQLINTVGTGTILNDDSVQGGPPVISSFTPGSGPVGAMITLTGKYFNGATQVAIHDVVVLSFTVVNSTTMNVVVPPGAISGRWRVTTPAGKGFAATDFMVTP